MRRVLARRAADVSSQRRLLPAVGAHQISRWSVDIPPNSSSRNTQRAIYLIERLCLSLNRKRAAPFCEGDGILLRSHATLLGLKWVADRRRIGTPEKESWLSAVTMDIAGSLICTVNLPDEDLADFFFDSINWPLSLAPDAPPPTALSEMRRWRQEPGWRRAFFRRRW